MPRYLVRIVVGLPPDMPPDDRASLLERESRRAAELKDAGIIENIWRIPGRLANVGIWRAATATALHEAIASLPVWRWTEIDVAPLADHYLTTDPEGSGGERAG